MYSLVSAIAKSFSSLGRWESVDISQMTFAQLFASYTRVTAVLTNPFIDGPVALDLASILGQVGDTNTTVTAFLTANANNALPTFTPVPVLKHKHVQYRDAFRAGYSVQPVGPYQAPDAQLPAKDKTYLHITNPNVADFREFYKYCLVSVNGYLHRTDADQNGAWVIDGTKSLWKSNRNQIGFLNFQGVSTLNFVPITPQMVYKQSSSQALANQMRIDVGQDLSNKGLMLVLGGYLHFLDERTFRRIGDQQILIDFNNLPLFERYHESREVLDYSGLPFQTTTRNPSQIAVADFLSDANLTAYVTMSQSFLVIMDNPEVYRDSAFVQTVAGPGMLVAHQFPDKPLMNGIGKLADYWSVFEDQQWSVRVVDNNWNRRVYGTMQKSYWTNIADSRLTQDPVRYSRAQFMVIGTDLAYQESTS
jgi:hypothetical protein